MQQLEKNLEAISEQMDAKFQDRVSETVNGLRALAKKYEITPTGLHIHTPLDFNEWIDCGSQIVTMHNAIRWCIGDWLAYGEGRGDWGEMYAQAMDGTRLSYNTLRACAWVSQRFQFVRRRTNLSWSHHSEVSAIEDDVEQDRILNEAEAKEWTRDDLREYLKSLKLLKAPAVFSSESNEWYTPALFIEAAREVMGGIDLDPASCAKAQQTVKAAQYFSKDDDGLVQQWHGR